MKKLYLALCGALLAMSAQAREFSFYLGTEPIADGSTLTFEDIHIVDEGTFVSVEMAPDLYVSSDIFTNTAVVTAECTSGQGIQLCAGGACASGTTVTKKNVTISAKGMVPLKYDYTGEFDLDEEIPTVTSIISVTDEEHPDVKTSFTIVMGKNAGVAVIENNASLFFNGSAIEYDLDSATAFALFNTAGTQVSTATLEGHGTIATDGLDAGIYVYRLGDRTGKIYIK